MRQHASRHLVILLMNDRVLGWRQMSPSLAGRSREGDGRLGMNCLTKMEEKGEFAMGMYWFSKFR